MPAEGQDDVVRKLVGGTASSEFFDEEFRRALEGKVRGALPAERRDARLRQLRIKRELDAEGSVTSNVTGQKLGSVDARTYYRWNLEWPGCWQIPEFVQAFFADNPQCRNRGWKPKQYATRKGVTFSQGVAVSPHKALHLT